MSNRPPGGPMDPTQLSQVLVPKPYSNVSELLGTMGQLLILGERSQDSEFKRRYLDLFDTMYRGFVMYMDKEFYITGPNNILSIKNKVEDAKPLIFTNNSDNEEEDGPEAS